MLAWIADQANVFYFVFGVAVLLLLALGWRTRRAKYWSYAAGAASLLLLVFILTKFVVTDRQQIALNLEAMRRATIDANPDALFAHISKDFRFGTRTRDELYNRVAAAIKTNKIKQISFSRQQVTVNGNSGEAFFNFHADADVGRYPASANARFVREAGQWKLIELHILQIGTTNRQFVPGID